MLNKYVEISKLAGDIRLMSSPEYLQLFVDLLKAADQNGQQLFNASQYARIRQIERTAFDRILKDMVEMGFIAKEMRNGKTWITICNYDYYIVPEAAVSTAVAMNPQSVGEKCEVVEEKEKQEKKSSPCTPLKEEKEKKEKAANNNNNNDDESCGSCRNDNLCFSVDGEKKMNCKRVLKLGQKKIEERKNAFFGKFRDFMLQPSGKFKTRWYQLEDFIKNENITAYFTTAGLTSEFMGYWTREVVMCDADGEEVGTVLQFETENGWNWWQRITSFVRRGYEIKQNKDARDTQRKDQVAASKARRRTAESNSQKAFAQMVKARLEAGYSDRETDEDDARLGVGFSHFMKLFRQKNNIKAAEIEWKKLSKDDKIDALKGAEPYCEYCEDSEIKMVNPDTYLRNRRWEDQIPKEYWDYWSDDSEATEKEGISFIEKVYADIEKKIDKKFEQTPEKQHAERAGDKTDEQAGNEASRVDLKLARA